MRRLSRLLSAATFSAALAGCAGTSTLYCPALKSYAAADQAKLAGEFSGLPIEARALINDYGLLRRECKAIKK